MASVSIDLILGRLVSIFESEASLLGGVSSEIDTIKQELAAMRSFLMDSDNKTDLTESEKTWTTQVRHIAHQVETMIDEFTYHVNSHQLNAHFTSFLRKPLHFPNNLYARRQIATKLKQINKTVRAIPEMNRRYGVKRVEGSSSSHNDDVWLRNLGESSLFTNEDRLVGIESERKLLMEQLMDGGSQLSIVSLIGMGGSGKSTLAAKTCANETVKHYFECHAWITVSRTYASDDLFRRMIKELFGATKEEIPPNLSSLAYKDLFFLLLGYLMTRRYLIVLDDVWEVKILMEMTMLFQNSHLGSRIIVTTRNEDVGSFSFGFRSHSRQIRLRPLSSEESWTLFSMKAFSNSCPPEIELVARELVGRCNGLPLAIVALGGLMGSKRTKQEWNTVLGNLSWQLSNNPMLEAVTKRILLLSYNDLPYRLKHCFLYCSMFPEDYRIRRKRLIRLWLAEGFVERVNRISPEELAESYLLELVSRSMLQVVSTNAAGKPDVCKMHDLLRELALSMSETDNCFLLYDGKQTHEHHETRRLAVQVSDRELESFPRASQLCSLLVFDNNSLTTLPSGLKLLRVLDLEDSRIDKVPTELPYLFNLRYLSFRGTAIKELPKSIGNLRNLESLDIRDTRIEKLPNGISKCKSLTHLVTYRYTEKKHGDYKCFYGTRAPSAICKLKKLQVLACIEAEGEIIRGIGDMTQLTSLGMTNVGEEDGMDLCVSIQKLKALRYLDLMAKDEFEGGVLRTETLSSPPPLLENLVLVGKLNNTPHWFPLLKNLTCLHLHRSRLADDPLSKIGEIPCLAELLLVNAYEGECLHFLAGYVNLRRLYLRDLSQVSQIVIQEGVMPDLRVLELTNVMELKKTPLGIEYLAKLEEMELRQVSRELVRRVCGEGAVDRPKVKHITHINYYYRTANEMLNDRNISYLSDKGVSGVAP